MPNGLTRHHVIAQNMDGTWHKDNLVSLDRRIHDAVHTLFGNDPPYHILRQVTERYKATMDSQAYNLINGVLVQIENVVEAYNPNCYNGTRLKEYLTRSNELRNPPHNRT